MVLSVNIVGGYSVHKDNKHIMKAQRKEMIKWMFYIVFSMKKFRDYLAKVSIYKEEERSVFRKAAEHFTRRSFRGMQGMDSIMIDSEKPMPYPLLIISGEHDLELSKDAGHCANLDNPEIFNEIYKEFITSR